jgi:hypothetical protein
MRTAVKPPDCQCTPMHTKLQEDATAAAVMLQLLQACGPRRRGENAQSLTPTVLPATVLLLAHTYFTTCLPRQQDPGMWPCRRGETRTCAVREPWRNGRRRRRRKRNEEEEKEDKPKQEEEEEGREEERKCTACPHNPAGER